MKDEATRGAPEAGVATLYTRLLSDEEGFLVLARSLEELAGIPLLRTEKNLALMAGRLAKVVAAHGCSGYREFHALMSREAGARRDFLSHMTTHTTQFFREPAHFQFIRDHLPDLVKRRRAEGKVDLRAWSAASSTGEEAWSLAMTLSDALAGLVPSLDLKILATDIDQRALVRGARAVYAEASVAPIPPTILQKYFVAGQGASEGLFRVRRSLRSRVTFAEFNLQEAKYPFEIGFDIIFCRNVFIYFDKERILACLDNFEKVLRPGGYLFVGHSEAIVGMRSKYLKKVAPAVFLRESSKEKLP